MRFAAVYLIFAVALVAIPLWLRTNGLRTCVSAALGALLAVAITAAIGTLWDRPRPFFAEHFTPLISHAADASFPSDHLAALGAVTICVWFTSRRLDITVGSSPWWWPSPASTLACTMSRMSPAGSCLGSYVVPPCGG